MKKNSLPSLYFMTNPLKAVSTGPDTKPAQQQAPYLRAVLSGTAHCSKKGNDTPEANPDRVAALRYIKESTLLKK